MRKSIFPFLAILFFPLFLIAQNTESQYINWFGEDTVANSMVWAGMDHAMNIEFEKARTFLDAAINRDPSLFAPYVQLAILSGGDMRDHYKAEAKKRLAGNNEVSTLFASLMDIESGPGAGDIWRSTWKKMSEVAPDGRYVQFQYALSLQDNEARIAALKKLAALNDADGNNNGHVHNILAYAYYATGEKEKAKMHLDKYLELRPNGYNAYDSMGEYYMNEGDAETALEYYKKARRHYPGATNARAKIEELNTQIANQDKGNLMLINSEYVRPEHVEDYMKWGKEYKEVAVRTNFKDFYVSSGDGAFHYIANVGKELSGVDAYQDTWDEWNKANPELDEMYNKYKHTVHKTTRSVWRHMPAHSYSPEATSDAPNTYSRVYYAYIKFGHEEAAMDILAEFKPLWESSGVTEDYQVYRNVFGEEDGCIAIVSGFASPKEWIADQEDVMTKVGKEKLQDLMNRWNKLVRKGKSAERYPQADLSHMKPQS